jgi:hypothetical protein
MYVSWIQPCVKRVNIEGFWVLANREIPEGEAQNALDWLKKLKGLNG